MLFKGKNSIQRFVEIVLIDDVDESKFNALQSIFNLVESVIHVFELLIHCFEFLIHTIKPLFDYHGQIVNGKMFVFHTPSKAICYCLRVRPLVSQRCCSVTLFQLIEFYGTLVGFSCQSLTFSRPPASNTEGRVSGTPFIGVLLFFPFVLFFVCVAVQRWRRFCRIPATFL